MDIGSYPYMKNEKWGLNIVLRSQESGLLEEATHQVKKLILDLGGSPIQLGN